MKVIMLGQPQDMTQGQLAAFASMIIANRLEIMWESDFRSQEGTLDVGFFVHNLKEARVIVTFTKPAIDLLIPLGAALWDRLGIPYQTKIMTFHAAREIWLVLHDGPVPARELGEDIKRPILEVRSSAEVMLHLKNLDSCYNDDLAKCAECPTQDICREKEWLEERAIRKAKEKATEGAE